MLFIKDKCFYLKIRLILYIDLFRRRNGMKGIGMDLGVL